MLAHITSFGPNYVILRISLVLKSTFKVMTFSYCDNLQISVQLILKFIVISRFGPDRHQYQTMKTVNINTFSVQNSLNVDTTRGMRRHWASVDQFLSFQPSSSSRYNPTFDNNYPADWGLPKVMLSPSSPSEEEEVNNRTIISVPSSLKPTDKGSHQLNKTKKWNSLFLGGGGLEL